MNNETNGYFPETNSPVELKSTSKTIEESAAYLKILKRITEELQDFNRAAREYLVNVGRKVL